MNSTTLSQVLVGVAKSCPFSQKLLIKFETRNGWDGYIQMFLKPWKYGHAAGKQWEFTFPENNFEMIFQVEKETFFSKWKEISFLYSDVNSSSIINLCCEKYFESYRSHYSGHQFCSWMDFVDSEYRIHAEILEEIENDRNKRTKWNRFKKWSKDFVNGHP